MITKDPDLFVTWTRTDEPGENPTWASQCGKVVQIGFGDTPLFVGFVAPENKKTRTRTTVISTKQMVEEEFQKTNKLTWNYDEESLT